MRQKTGEAKPEKTYAVRLTKDELGLLFKAADAVVNNLTRVGPWYQEDKEVWDFCVSQQAYENLRSAKNKVMAVNQDVAAGRAA